MDAISASVQPTSAGRLTRLYLPYGTRSRSSSRISTINRTTQTFRAALYHARNKHEAFVKPNLNFGITKEEVTKREVSEAEENAVIEALRGDFHDIFVFALLSGIRESGLCTLERSKVDLTNAQVTFRSKRHRGDPPGFIRWETQALV
jgi:integrase